MAEQTERRRTLYRRVADYPLQLDRPAVVQSRARGGTDLVTGARIPFPEGRWLVLSPWPFPGTSARRTALVTTHAEGLALAIAAARAHGQDGGDRG